MTARVTIPAELAADVAARPEAYRPRGALGDGSPVLVLASAPDNIAGEVCTPGTMRPDGALHISTWFNLHATAWALVGSVDGGPRPEPGDRVLVLEAPDAGVHRLNRTAVVVDPSGLISGKLIVDQDGWPLHVTRWAILPPAPEPAPSFIKDMAAAHPAEPYVPRRDGDDL